MCAPAIIPIVAAAAGAFAVNEITKPSDKPSSPKAAPPAPTAPKAPQQSASGEQTNATDEALAGARNKQAKQAQLSKGRDSTVLTGPQGLLGGANTRRKTLLGQ